MVNLTQPALLCFGKVPEDPVFRHHFLQVEGFLQAYKEVGLSYNLQRYSYTYRSNRINPFRAALNGFNHCCYALTDEK